MARERMYIEMTEAPSQEQLATFQMRMLALNMPVFYALTGERVLGWADISAAGNPRLAHRGFLGMGLLPEARGLGLGQKVCETTPSDMPEQTSLEKVEFAGLYQQYCCHWALSQVWF